MPNNNNNQTKRKHTGEDNKEYKHKQQNATNQ